MKRYAIIVFLFFLVCNYVLAKSIRCLYRKRAGVGFASVTPKAKLGIYSSSTDSGIYLTTIEIDKVGSKTMSYKDCKIHSRNPTDKKCFKPGELFLMKEFANSKLYKFDKSQYGHYSGFMSLHIHKKKYYITTAYMNIDSDPYTFADVADCNEVK